MPDDLFVLQCENGQWHVDNWCLRQEKTLLKPYCQGGVTLATGLKDSPGLQAKFTGRVTLLPKTTLVPLR